MVDGSQIATSLGTAVAVVGLFVLLEKQLIAAIRFGKLLAAELCIKKNVQRLTCKG